MSKDKVKKLFGKSQRVWILVAIMLVLTILQPGVFLTGANMKSILLSISIYGIMVCGTIFPILLGGIDLSVGAVAAAAGALAVTQIVDHNYSCLLYTSNDLCAVALCNLHYTDTNWAGSHNQHFISFSDLCAVINFYADCKRFYQSK